MFGHLQAANLPRPPTPAVKHEPHRFFGPGGNGPEMVDHPANVPVLLAPVAPVHPAVRKRRTLVQHRLTQRPAAPVLAAFVEVCVPAAFVPLHLAATQPDLEANLLKLVGEVAVILLVHQVQPVKVVLVHEPARTLGAHQVVKQNGFPRLFVIPCGPALAFQRRPAEVVGVVGVAQEHGVNPFLWLARLRVPVLSVQAIAPGHLDPVRLHRVHQRGVKAF